ncbi:hypothetical protein DERP_007626 [Dermatophagoides pteronyssinus]|uniref:Uncharacterized protein n=1 Tax=Dermatophagoides pteronyssinus TaxID=6956 RepID=A0ABQ8JK96_DERPT|nr:hypothetical protein DERP_007626 [Dermatophagoides pteronyssinus]
MNSVEYLGLLAATAAGVIFQNISFSSGSTKLQYSIKKKLSYQMILLMCRQTMTDQIELN